MFTGIIEAMADVLRSQNGRLMLERPKDFTDVQIGSSICVSGVCLSVVALDKKSLTFDVVPETLRRSTLGSIEEGETVNIERAMKADGRFDGHIVQGHVEGVGVVAFLAPPTVSGEGGGGATLSVRIPATLLSAIFVKGSIAIDGVSLTVAAVEGDRVTVALIPHTLERTTLGALHAGDSVNVETDILCRYAAQCSRES